jgi:TrmH family RNA methyltransferase
MDRITSSSNPKIKKARSLRQRKFRAETGLFLIEGIHHLGSAVEGGFALEEIFYCPELLESPFARNLIEQQIAGGTPCYPVSEMVFQSLADKENPSGILGVGQQTHRVLPELSPDNFSWGVAVVSPQDPGNIGTILRTIDAVGASGLILLDQGVDIWHPTAVRASMGAIFWHPVVEAPFAEFADWAHQNRYFILGTSAHSTLDYQQAVFDSLPIILLLGSERAGLTSEQIKVCQAMVNLPMHGKVTSLNLAVAAGVLLYTISAQLKKLH